jgi:hypothetical protein
LVISKSDQGNIEINAINVDQIAREFAEIKNTMTIILFIACRNKSSDYNDQQALKKPATCYNGISIVFYSSEIGWQT